ncbi:hypothetical protein MMC07_009036, partial [Pseudocyphellaria aurata]|nr:hypothetical protein [Pseudocyphellaria aurata]
MPKAESIQTMDIRLVQFCKPSHKGANWVIFQGGEEGIPLSESHIPSTVLKISSVDPEIYKLLLGLFSSEGALHGWKLHAVGDPNGKDLSDEYLGVIV